MITAGINAPPASSCGRLFDAVAAALGLCSDRQAYEGEAAMRLEALVDFERFRLADGYRFELHPSAAHRNAPVAGQRDLGEFAAIDPRPMWEMLLTDMAEGVPVAVLSSRFHNGLAAAIAATGENLARRHCIDTVALSGGCFQNAVLLGGTIRRLETAGLTVLTHAAVPANDGGLALGQAAVAAARLLQGETPCA
jgi:hydrogenase maturation protein HypF